MPESGHTFNVLLILGLALFAGTVGAGLFQKLRIPQVVGSIAIGILVGESVLGWIPHSVVLELQPLSIFALGLIGFMIGGELRSELLRKYGRQFITILLSEGLAAFVLVGILAGAVTYYVVGSVPFSFAVGVMLGAIASATAPAATVDVLWEYRAKGPLTTTVLAIVALDDALSLFLFGFASSLAGAVIGKGGFSLSSLIATPFYEIAGSLALGCAVGFLLYMVLKASRQPDKLLAFTLGLVLLTSGLSELLHLDVILAVMALGVTLVNAAPHRSRTAFELVETFAPPIYVLFFVLVGARLRIAHMEKWWWVLAAVYVAARTLGKMGGAWLGAVWSHAAPVVRRYLGLCLFSQAGVAVGLSVLVGHRFPGELGEVVVAVIATTTFLVQIIGPPCVKLAAQKAGETGLDMTEEDLIRSYSVGQVMDPEPPVLPEDARLGDILKTFAETSAVTFPVVDRDRNLLGLITLQEIKEAVASQGFQELLVAYDLMEPAQEVTTPDTPLSEALEKLRLLRLEGMPVVRSKEDRRLVGFLDARAANTAISEEILKRRDRNEGSITLEPRV